jgi:hypothetical protein
MMKRVPERRPNPQLANPVYENGPKDAADRVAAQAHARDARTKKDEPQK